ncbi:hypothetical protein CATMIT_01837, partial [Catenibacterium mitsuokai DSM 15897]
WFVGGGVVDDARGEGELLGQTGVLRVAPARMRRLPVARAALQPGQAVNRAVVLVLVRAGLHLDPDQIARIGAQDRRVRIAGEHAAGERRIGRIAADGVERVDGAVGAALEGIGQVAAEAAVLRAAGVVVDARGQRFVAVVHHHHADVVGRDRLRARPRRLLVGEVHRAGKFVGLRAAGAMAVVFEDVLGHRAGRCLGRLAHRGMDRVQVAVRAGLGFGRVLVGPPALLTPTYLPLR